MHHLPVGMSVGMPVAEPRPEQKSGIPVLVEILAPVKQTMLPRCSWKSVASSAMDAARVESVSM